jgi:hypothetical protein
MGNKIATPLTDPNPGIAPMNKPTVTPTIISPKFIGSSAVKIPLNKKEKTSIMILGSGQT